MEEDLLMKEDQFYKENQKLEEKTKQLMKKVNDVMKIQDNLIKDTFQTKVEISNVRKNTYKFTKKPTEDEMIFDQSEENFSETGSQAYNTGLCKVYKTKLKNVVAEKERVLIDVKQKNDEIKKLQKENQHLQQEKEKWFLAYSAGKNNIGKLETQITGLNARHQTKDSENFCLKKEVEQLKKDLKITTANLTNCDVRLNRSSEEVEKLRNALKKFKEEERDMKESHRKQVNELAQTIKQLEKQKFEVLSGFEKQAELIENLKKQNMYLEAHKLLEVLESDYLKMLSWDTAEK